MELNSPIPYTLHYMYLSSQYLIPLPIAGQTGRPGQAWRDIVQVAHIDVPGVV
jgi:hypothetical protein